MSGHNDIVISVNGKDFPKIYSKLSSECKLFLFSFPYIGVTGKHKTEPHIHIFLDDVIWPTKNPEINELINAVKKYKYRLQRIGEDYKDVEDVGVGVEEFGDAPYPVTSFSRTDAPRISVNEIVKRYS